MRTALSKKIRFEVFKRDKFTCQYCGGKAPDVVLNVDHIEPVSKGGSNDTLNLLTSCFSCNAGKKDRRLDDNSVLEKQRNQLEHMQERREQMELMHEWKKSLEMHEEKIRRKVKRYINAKIKPYTISDHAFSKIKLLINKHDADQVMNAVDIASVKYLKYGSDGQITQSSAGDFIDKIGGIVFNKNLTPIAQKISFIKGIAKSHFNYYDSQTASSLLNNYVAAMREYWGYDDDQIVNDLEGEVLIKTKDAYSWSDWRKLLEGWIDSIKSQAGVSGE